MHYIVFLLFLIMSAGCVTTGSMIGIIPEVEPVIQPVSNSPIPPNWVLGREHQLYAHAQHLVGVGFSIRILFQQVSLHEQSYQRIFVLSYLLL